ncbi:MazG family protein [Marmoricola sp. RAF53]|uniref:MazG family protein n=1 Tax=Marmoricola sp. RAF53 TaxID=3233059 RepID=UPI003F9B98BB
MTGPDADPGTSALVELTEVMARLRVGCAWKAGQTHTSLVRYLLEETYETVEAIESGDSEHLREELGDLLLQVWFHAEIAAEEGRFGIEDVAADLVAKMRRRNPHVFAPEEASADAGDPESINEQWERIKAAEKRRGGMMDGVPEELPALLRAVKALDRLDRAGGVPEIDPASADLGVRLLALAAEARATGTDPEQALRAAVRSLVGSDPG